MDGLNGSNSRFFIPACLSQFTTTKAYPLVQTLRRQIVRLSQYRSDVTNLLGISNAGIIYSDHRCLHRQTSSCSQNFFLSLQPHIVLRVLNKIDFYTERCTCTSSLLASTLETQLGLDYKLGRLYPRCYLDSQKQT